MRKYIFKSSKVDNTYSVDIVSITIVPISEPILHGTVYFSFSEWEDFKILIGSGAVGCLQSGVEAELQEK